MKDAEKGPGERERERERAGGGNMTLRVGMKDDDESCIASGTVLLLLLLLLFRQRSSLPFRGVSMKLFRKERGRLDSFHFPLQLCQQLLYA
jgi:hypothetical protein